ncbi:MAG: hypothetical protein JNM48_15775 [Rhodospirillales bacterium]|nr:hypothetical protein [Rhodospirillales bacterium]
MSPVSKPWYLSKGFVGPLVTAVLFSLRSLGIADIDPATAIGFLYQGAEFAGIFAGMVGRAVATTRLTLGPAQSGSGRGGGCGRRFRKGKAKAASPGRAARLTGGER